MQVPIQVTVRDAPVPDHVRATCRAAAQGLERHYERITACRVVITAPHRQHRTGNEHEVTVTLLVPGGQIVGRQAAEGLEAAIQEAFDATLRRLDEHVERLGERSPEPAALHGRIVRLAPPDAVEDYAFLETPDGSEYFVHRDDVRGDFEALQPGVEVHFVPEPPPPLSAKCPIARAVHIVGSHRRIRPFQP